MRLPKDRRKWTPKHATQVLAERDEAWNAYEACDRMSPEAVVAFNAYQRAEDLAQDVCVVASVKAARIV